MSKATVTAFASPGLTMVADAAPGVVAKDGSTRFEGLTFAGSCDVFDLTVEHGSVRGISAGSGPARWLCLPPLADLHVHANRAFTPPQSRPVGLEDAARKVGGVFATFTAADYERHACMLVEAAYRHATTHLRSHADIDTGFRLEAVAGSLSAAAACRDRVELEVVAFAGGGLDPAGAEGRAALREAVAMGACYLGAAPAFCADAKATIDAILDLALELDVPVDLHLDEHLDAARSVSGYLAAATRGRGLDGRVTLGHGCAISALPARERLRVIDALAAARVTVIALPRTNLYLQDAGGGTPQRRGITPVQEMLDAGIAVRFASDNVRDAFYPYGDADLLGVAMDGILASQLDEPQQVVAAICDGRSSLAVGDQADMVLIPGASVDAVLADPPAQRWIVRGGKAMLP